MFDRFWAGFSAASDCWQVLKRDRKLLLLPLVSGISCLAVILSFALPLWSSHPEVLGMVFGEESASLSEAPPWFWAMTFAFYFCNYFVIYFFNAALVHCALFHFREIPVSVTDGLRAALRRLPQLISWALVSATIGLLLRMLEGTNKKGKSLFAALLGTTWTIATYFVVPVLVVERVGPVKAVKRSARILRETWGEALGGRLGIGWFTLPFNLIGILLLWLGVSLLKSSLVAGTAILGGAVLYVVGLGLVTSALETILLAGLYLYGTQGEVPEAMDERILSQAFLAE